MKKNLFIVFGANMITLVISVCSGFLLPAYLSISSYGYYKMFQLYLNFVGMTHLGYADGIYLKYGGEDFENIDKEEISSISSTLRTLQIIFSIGLLLVSLVLKNSLIFFLALSLVPVNLITFYKNLYQATGKFYAYSNLLVLIPVISFILDILLIIFRIDNYLYYILAILISNYILYFILEINNYKLTKRFTLLKTDFKSLVNYIKLGLPLLIGNFISLFITSIDRWFIQMLMTISDFSYYSFAVSIENIFNTCVTAVTTTMYNYLCKLRNVDEVKKIKSYCVVGGVFLISFAFPVKQIILWFLPKYKLSLDVLFILISAHALYFVIKAIYVNLYKARGRQKYYLLQIVLVLIISVFSNYIGFFFITKTREIFAYATLLTAFFWFWLCHTSEKNIKSDWNEIIYLIVSILIYIIIGHFIDSPIIGFIIYIMFLLIWTFLFEKEIALSLLLIIKKQINNFNRNF